MQIQVWLDMVVWDQSINAGAFSAARGKDDEVNQEKRNENQPEHHVQPGALFQTFATTASVLK